MIVIRILSILYPVLIFLAISYLGIETAAGCVIIFGILLWVLTKILPAFKKATKADTVLLRYDIVALVMIFLGSCALFFNSENMLLFYSVVINIALFVLFFGSLFTKRTIVERFARLGKLNLPDRVITYTRSVTKCWCLFFVVNGTIAFITAYYFSLSVWMFYNGFITYILMGILFGVEFLVRIRVMKNIQDA